jgi:hypothetical protein
MLRRNLHLAMSLMLMLAITTSILPATTVKADEGSTSWGDFFDTDGNLLPGVIEAGEVSQPADWMPDLPDWTGLSVDATYHQFVSPEGETILIPSTTTLFFMAMNPEASGLVNSNGQLGSGLGLGVELAGQVASGNGASFISALVQNLAGMSQVEADKFADAAINGQNVWSLLSPSTDVSRLLTLFLNLSQKDGNVYLLALMYQSCSNSPAGCPAELCAANPVACGLPPTTEPEETPTEPPTCPAPSVSQASPSLSISPSAPPYPLAVGQDPDKRGADVSGRVSIPPVIFTWYEPIYEEVRSCSAGGSSASSNCTRHNGQPGVMKTDQVLTDCKAHVEHLPEQINTVNARAELSGESRAWILNDLGAKWYGAYVHKGSFNLAQIGSVSKGCSGGTCTASLDAPKVPFADPGLFNLSLSVGTNGTFWNGQQITQPRILSTCGEIKVYVVLPTLIDASTAP